MSLFRLEEQYAKVEKERDLYKKLLNDKDKELYKMKKEFNQL